MTLAIGVDVGGTKIAAGAVDEDGRIVRVVRVPTPTTGPGAVEAIARLARQVAGDDAVVAVGIGAPGFVDAERSRVVVAPNLAWREEPVRDEVAARVPWPVFVENDANSVAWAEYRFGAGRGADPLVAVTVGTGIGGGIVVDGRLFRGGFGLGAEVGHIRVVPDGHLCGCGNRGCWEQYASGHALVRVARELAAARPAEAAGLLALGDGTPDGVQGEHVTTAAHHGDVVALAAFAEVARWLGQGLADLAAVLDPLAFVIGGGVSEVGELLLGPAREAYRAALTIGRYRPVAEIRQATMGNDAGIVGAADLART